MPKPRGKEHTTLTETAQEVVRILKGISGVKMIAPGEIKTNSRKGTGARFVTAVYTTAGMELIISGQSVQKVAIHTDGNPKNIFKLLKEHKKMRNFEFKQRERKPGI
ncbi:MAG: hypothetical protein ACI92I_000090 [Acidimicrobiales bacterium]|jgi:hypothetical protein